MSKKLKIQFWRAEKALAMQILEQEGLPQQKANGEVRILGAPQLCDDRIFLRGTAKWNDLKIAHTHIEFNTQYDLNAYLHWAVNAITDELFTGKGELKIGEMCELRDYKDEQWQKRKLIAILPARYKGRFIAEWGDNPSKHSHWNYARPITKRTEPTIEECGNAVTYTWEEK
jgi:hypothetical protein